MCYMQISSTSFSCGEKGQVYKADRPIQCLPKDMSEKVKGSIGENPERRSSVSSSEDAFVNEFSDEEDEIEADDQVPHKTDSSKKSTANEVEADNQAIFSKKSTENEVEVDDQAIHKTVSSKKSTKNVSNRSPKPDNGFMEERDIETDDAADEHVEADTDDRADVETAGTNSKTAITLDEDDTETEDHHDKEAETVDIDANTEHMDVDIDEAKSDGNSTSSSGDNSATEEGEEATFDVAAALESFDWYIPEDNFDRMMQPDQQMSPQKGQKNIPGHSRMREKIIDALKTKKYKFPRIFHSKSNPGREPLADAYGGSMKKQMMGMSPMLMLSNIAKKSKMDVTKFFENADSMLGMQLTFPCMQCYEKYGPGSRAGGGGYQDDSYYGYGKSKPPKDGKCARCGGSVMTAGSYGQMITKMREKLQSKSLTVHDVYPDGNCLFGAVVDQLRIRGDFRFTITSLRKGCVNYLRNNPNADDGTPYAMFLTENESWEQYLIRMSTDGEWGDHMVLNAIATIVNHNLIIYGGMVGDGETVIRPRGYKEPSEEEEEEEEDKEGAESVPDLEPLFLGHFGESHYFSLRPGNWQEQLQERIDKCAATESELVPPTPLQEFSQKLLPIYCDSMLQTLFSLEYVTSLRSDVIDVLYPGRQENDKFFYEMMGPVINKAQSILCEIESIGPDVDIFFPGCNESSPEKKDTSANLVMFCTPTDTKVVFNPTNARKFDLICEIMGPDLPGQMKLVPKNPELWKWVVVKQETGLSHIKTFDVGHDSMSLFPVIDEFPDIRVHPVIAFRCRWPDEAYDWINRQRCAQWLDDDFIRSVITGPCHVVPVLSSENTREITNDFASPEQDGQTWVISFAAAEKKLLEKITSTQRHCFLLLQLYLASLSKDDQLPASVAKSVFFYACQNIETSVWEEHPGICFKKLLQNLALGLEDKVIPHFFIASKNLVQFVPENITREFGQKLRNYCHQPFVGLFFFLDQFNITTSEVGPFIDGIIEDVFKEQQNRNVDSFFLQVMLPSFATMLYACSLQEEYRDAEKLAKLVKQEIWKFCGEDVSIADIIKAAVGGTHGGYDWILALYFDIINGTLHSRDIHGNRPTVSIVEVFGPECLEELPDTLIDTQFNIQNGDLVLPMIVESILRQLGKDRAITKCIRYYLDTLNDLAGEKFVLGPGCGHHHTSSMHSQICSMAHVSTLHQLYLLLFNAYLRLKCHEEFRDLLPTLTKLTETVGTSHAYKNLRLILLDLKEYDKAKALASGMPSGSMMSGGPESAGGGVMQMFSQMLMGLGSSDYYDSY